MPSLQRALISLAAAACIGAGPVATASDFTLTLSTSQTPVAVDQAPTVRLTLKNVSGQTLYLDPLDISLFHSFHLVELASGAERDIIGEHILVELPTHTGNPLLPGGSITLASHLPAIHAAGAYRVTAAATLQLPSKLASIDLGTTNSIVLFVRSAVPDSEIDAHIDAGIPAERRAYVHKVMLTLAPTMRGGAIAGYDKNGHFFSNHLADYAAVAHIDEPPPIIPREPIPRTMIGTWSCTNAMSPGASFLLVLRADATGFSQWPGGQADRFSYELSDGWIIERAPGKSAYRQRIAISKDVLTRSRPAYRHEANWAALPDMADDVCRRV